MSDALVIIALTLGLAVVMRAAQLAAERAGVPIETQLAAQVLH